MSGRWVVVITGGIRGTRVIGPLTREVAERLAAGWGAWARVEGEQITYAELESPGG